MHDLLTTILVVGALAAYAFYFSYWIARCLAALAWAEERLSAIDLRFDFVGAALKGDRLRMDDITARATKLAVEQDRHSSELANLGNRIDRHVKTDLPNMRTKLDRVEGKLLEPQDVIDALKRPNVVTAIPETSAAPAERQGA